ncbi:DUF7287 family protein [Halohasta salina]|uniref:DUF7287 family protein n=1 Tax=Halohasta salina TaxID=2961621 RepID=UPI0020A42A50|nr:hypothetical protein [Halohasta salina]
MNRAQTVIDFGVGAGVFIIAVGVVFAFVPAIFEPFSGAASSTPVVADRAVDHLSGSLLAADPAAPGTLSPACTAAFMNATNVSGADCGFDAATPATELLGIGDREVNVTLRHPADPPRTGPPVDGSDLDSVAFDGPLTREAGGSTPTDVTVSSRIVSIEDSQYRLVVKVW